MSENRGGRNDHSNAKRAEGITEIRVGGFKSIVKPQAIEIRPLTILAGANNSGKSSIIQPVLLLKQTLDASFDPGPLWLGGPNVTFTSTDQFFSRTGSVECSETLDVGISAGIDTGFDISFTRDPSAGIQIREFRFQQEGKRMTLRPKMSETELQMTLNSYSGHSSTSIVSHRFVPEEWKVVREKCFLRVEKAGPNSESVYSPGYALAHFINELFHLPGLRGNAERTYAVTGVGPTFPGTFEIYVASMIARWQTENDDERLMELNQQLKGVGLARSVKAVRINDAQLELHVDRLPATSISSSDFVNIADVGFGVSQTLPVIVALLTASPGQIVYIEQPETHLHPRAQVRMAGVLAEAARRGVRVIAETHSSLLLRAVQTLVAKGELAPDLVKLHWFTRNEKDGATEVRSADLDADGAFGEWPSDFSEVELRSEGDYLDAVGLRSAR